MSRQPIPTSRTHLYVALATAGIVLSGCSASGAQNTSEQPISSVENTSTPSASSDGYPSCDEVKAALGPALDSLIELDGSENGVSTGADGPSLACSWFTPETDGSSIHVEQYGGISLGISRDPEFTEERMEPLGWNVEDPRVSGADAWAVKVGGGYDPNDQLDVTGVQVVRDGIVVVLTSGGVALQDVEGLASLTNDWALGAGVAVLELMK
jgi:hypothetical protein